MAPQMSAMTMSSPFGALKQVDAGVLSVGYAEAGTAGGPAVLLLHGWPYDIHSFAAAAPGLAAAGYRVIVPFARGYGTTRFLSGDMVRDGQQAFLAVEDQARALGDWVAAKGRNVTEHSLYWKRPLTAAVMTAAAAWGGEADD
jgi:pimeloyl-ACP methyl ester carboxylesterase